MNIKIRNNEYKIVKDFGETVSDLNLEEIVTDYYVLKKILELRIFLHQLMLIVLILIGKTIMLVELVLVWFYLMQIQQLLMMLK